jgi:drug/metabolite transporter (DMT)-like permease
VVEDTRHRIALPAVIVGVLAVGASAVFIRLAEAPALGIAFWRCALGALALLPLAAFNREGMPKGRDLWVGTVSGIALGAHFGTWIASLQYTSVAASVVLVSTTPVFVAVAAYPLFGERTSAMSFAGIVLAIAGTAVIAGGEHSSGGAAFFGNILALIGTITMAVYVLIGRSLRTGAWALSPIRSSATLPPRLPSCSSPSPLASSCGATPRRRGSGCSSSRWGRSY